MYDRFLTLLKQTNITAGKVAKATGINRSTFSHWKSGDYTPKIETLQKIADFFNVPVNYFYGENKYYFDDETSKLAQALHDNNYSTDFVFTTDTGNLYDDGDLRRSLPDTTLLYQTKRR